MPKYICTVKAIIYITKEVCDTIEIEAPDEVQAEEDAVTAAGLMDKKTWLNHPEADFIEDEYFEFEVENVEELNGAQKYE